jgi:hypothetical protein
VIRFSSSFMLHLVSSLPSNSRKIAEAHLGDSWVESTLGQGSTFHVSLPEQKAPDERALHTDLCKPRNVR